MTSEKKLKVGAMTSIEDHQTRSRAAWNSHFGGVGYVFGKQPNGWLATHRKELLKISNGKVLSVADGEGRNSVWLASLGMQVDAFDISPVAIAKAEALAEANDVTVNFCEASQTDFAWPKDYYDAVVAIFVQYATPEMRIDLFNRIKASLRKGGKVYLLGYTPKQLKYGTGGPRNIEHLYTYEMLSEEFGDMSILEIEEFEDFLNEGNGHQGASALISLVATKVTGNDPANNWLSPSKGMQDDG